MAALTPLVDGIDFGEGPRWHDGRLWYSDFYQRAIYAVAADGTREAVHADLPDQPSGLGWMPDGTLLVVSMIDRKVLRADGDGLVEHADLSSLASGLCNDMVVGPDGNAYVGNFGGASESGRGLAGRAPAELVLVRPDGHASVVARGLRFPNGAVITPDGSTLIVGETFASRYTAFTIAADGTLLEQRVWAEVPGTSPDGCCLDAEGAIWSADASGSQVVRILEGGEITTRIPTPMPTFACMLGGDDGRTLFVLCAPGSSPREVDGLGGGALFTTRVDVPHAGWP